MERHLVLFLPRKDGSIMHDHCLRVAEAKEQETGVWQWPEEYPQPQVPVGLEEIWQWYWDLRASAGSGINGPEPLRYSEIVAWMTLSKEEILPTHLRFLRILDAQYMRTYHDINKPPKGK